MSNKCQLTGKQLQFGHNVSHSNRKTKRTFLPNTQNVTFISDILGNISLKVTASTIRTVDINGGIDNYLLNARVAKLSEDAQKIRRRLLKAKQKKQAQ